MTREEIAEMLYCCVSKAGAQMDDIQRVLNSILEAADADLLNQALDATYEILRLSRDLTKPTDRLDSAIGLLFIFNRLSGRHITPTTLKDGRHGHGIIQCICCLVRRRNLGVPYETCMKAMKVLRVYLLGPRIHNDYYFRLNQDMEDQFWNPNNFSQASICYAKNLHHQLMSVFADLTGDDKCSMLAPAQDGDVVGSQPMLIQTIQCICSFVENCADLSLFKFFCYGAPGTDGEKINLRLRLIRLVDHRFCGDVLRVHALGLLALLFGHTQHKVDMEEVPLLPQEVQDALTLFGGDEREPKFSNGIIKRVLLARSQGDIEAGVKNYFNEALVTNMSLILKAALSLTDKKMPIYRFIIIYLVQLLDHRNFIKKNDHEDGIRIARISVVMCIYDVVCSGDNLNRSSLCHVIWNQVPGFQETIGLNLSLKTDSVDLTNAALLLLVALVDGGEGGGVLQTFSQHLVRMLNFTALREKALEVFCKCMETVIIYIFF